MSRETPRWAGRVSPNPSGSSSSDRRPGRSRTSGTATAKEQRSPYGSYWYRAVACILLSGRVQAKHDGAPNMTDVNRVGKEANFNQYLTERVGKFLVAVGRDPVRSPGPVRGGAEPRRVLGP